MRVRRTFTLSLFAVVLAAPLVPLGLTAQGATIDAPGVSRLSGGDRYATSVAISKSTFAKPAGVFLAAGTNFPDALSAGPAAAKSGAPVLLTAPTSLPAATASELRRTQPATVYVLGGTASVSNAVATAAGNYAGKVIRLGGDNRYETSVAVSRRFWSTSNVVYLATGAGYADALSGGPLAAKNGAPVLLSASKTLPAVINTELRRLKPTKVVLLGGTASLSTAVQTALQKALPGTTVSRLAGRDRFATSAAVVAAGWDTSARAFYANGLNFPDALSGVPVAATNDAPLLLTTKTCMPASINAISKRLSPATQVLLGGPGVLAQNVASTLCAATPPPLSTTAKYRAAVLNLTNVARVKAGCSELKYDGALTKAAQEHTDKMAKTGTLSHRLNGEDPLGTRITKAGYVWSTVGENVASGYPSPKDVVDGWLTSPSHRANILNCAFKDLGVGVKKDSSSQLWWTQDFGRKF